MKKLIILLLVIFSFADDIKNAYFDSYNYEKIGDYKDAIKVLIPIYKKYPKGYTLNLRLAYLFFLDKKYQNAIKYYQQASLSLPYSLEPKLGMMRIYLSIGEYQKAVEIGYSILKIDFYNYYGNLYTLQALKGLKRYDDAIAVANKILTIYPTDITYLVNLAKIYEITNPEYAKKIYKESVLILDPNNIAAKLYLNIFKKK
jgi:tetratricopeptide (TPR) repeat protein